MKYTQVLKSMCCGFKSCIFGSNLYGQLGLTDVILDKSGKFPKIKAYVAEGKFEDVKISVDLVPVFRVEPYQRSEPLLFAVAKDSLQNKSMPLCFSQFEEKLITSIPEYIRSGLCLAKMCLICMFQNPGKFHYKHDHITSYMLKTSLLQILYEHRNVHFKTELQNIFVKSATVFWANVFLRIYIDYFEKETLILNDSQTV